MLLNVGISDVRNYLKMSVMLEDNGFNWWFYFNFILFW